MAFALLVLSALALVGAAILWRSESGEQTGGVTRAAAPQPAESKPAPQPPAPQTEPASAPQPEPTPVPQPDPAPSSKTPTVVPAPEPDNEQPKKTHSIWPFAAGKPGKPGKPSRLRESKHAKARREWGEENGFDYAREDEFLTDEWTRGAAASGAPVRDVLTGTRFGHETRIADIAAAPAATTVVAMGTGMASDIVVDMRRGGENGGNGGGAAGDGGAAGGASEDLVEVAKLEGFTVFGSDVGPVERMIDVRVQTALELLPPQVAAVWFESEWVIAQLAGDTAAGPAEWEPVFAPLALLADAARTLPPQTWPLLDVGGGSREMGEAVASISEGRETEEPSRPHIARPEEPLEMPTRMTGGVRGAIDEHEVGSDEVSAIATGEQAPQPNDGTRMARRQDPPSIFQ